MFMYKDNDREVIGGNMMLSGYQYRSPKRYLKILNVLGGVDIERDYDSDPYSHLCPESRGYIYHL